MGNCSVLWLGLRAQWPSRNKTPLGADNGGGLGEGGYGKVHLAVVTEAAVRHLL